MRLFARANPEILMNDVPHCKFIVTQPVNICEELYSKANFEARSPS